MILCLTQDDFSIVSTAYKQQTATYGIAYCYLKDHAFTNLLGKSENLFITAHGNEDEIGNEGPKGFAFTPPALAKMLTASILPPQYAGSIYVSACDTAPRYVAGLQAAMGAGYARRIYGCVGKIALEIQPPTDRMWILAGAAPGARAPAPHTA